MPILPSARPRIQELLKRLESPAAAERESAVARLTLLGSRTIPHLQTFLNHASAIGRLAALDVLEGLGEAGTLVSVLPLTKDAHDDVACRAIEIAAGFPDGRAVEALRAALSSPSPSRRGAATRGLGRLHRLGLVEAVEPLLGVLVDTSEEDAVRLDALEWLSSLDRRSLEPTLQALTHDRSPAVGGAARDLIGRLSGAKGAKAALEADLPTLVERLESARTPSAEASSLVDALVERRTPALLPLLSRRLEASNAEAANRGKEATARSKARIHLALAALGSRIALHDLREMLKARPPYAARDLLAAAALVGDASLVQALAGLAADEPRLQDATAKAFRALARREALRRTSRVVSGLGPKPKAALLALWPTGRAASAGASRDRKRKPK